MVSAIKNASQSLALGRFAALSFCRADVLLQVADSLEIKFCNGPTEGIWGKPTTDIVGTRFLDLIIENDQELVRGLFKNQGKDSRIEDVIIRTELASGNTIDAAISGYRVPEFDNDFFLAVKIAPKRFAPMGRRDSDRHEKSGVLTKEIFTDVASERIKDYEAAGGSAKVSMVKVSELAALDNEEERERVFDKLGEVLRSESLGGDTAGQVDDENFSIVHDEKLGASALREKIASAISEVTPNAAQLLPKIATVDADTSQMSQQQVAKAMMFSLQSFASGDGELPDGDLNDLLEAKLQENMETMDRFREICETGDFDLVYMPVCHLENGAIHHFEALTRFREDPEASPFEMITLAEEVGIISAFDIAVAKKAISELTEEGAAPGLHAVAVNVSGHSISDTAFCEELLGMLKYHPKLANSYSLEITESAQIDDLTGVNAAIQEFRKLGYKVALDDFGAGAASFDYLNSFDVDTVKFDGPVVKRAANTRKGRAFLASMATLCREIEVETIAEMVEDEELADFLKTCGISLGQGWYYGKPDPNMRKFPPILPVVGMD